MNQLTNDQTTRAHRRPTPDYAPAAAPFDYCACCARPLYGDGDTDLVTTYTPDHRPVYQYACPTCAPMMRAWEA